MHTVVRRGVSDSIISCDYGSSAPLIKHKLNSLVPVARNENIYNNHKRDYESSWPLWQRMLENFSPKKSQAQPNTPTTEQN